MGNKRVLQQTSNVIAIEPSTAIGPMHMYKGMKKCIPYTREKLHSYY
jgi:hypothetical protein